MNATPRSTAKAQRSSGALSIRDSRCDDVPAIADIYAFHVAHGAGTFELDAPDAAEMGRRREHVLANRWPWLVAERAGRVVGYACADDFRPRRAYRYCVEDSVYVAADCVGHGIGNRLLGELIARCESAGARQMIAVIGDSANAASIGLHRAHGFVDVGVMATVGWKLGRWLDVVILQRSLGPGATTAPEEPA